MPIAEPFKALGRGNGMGVCIKQVDVSNYGRWTLFNGVNKSNFTEKSQDDIIESRSLAYNFYYNIFQFNLNAKILNTGLVDNTLTIANAEEFGKENVVPKDRLCNQSNNISNGSSAVPNFRNYAVFEKFYNGSTDNEENFIGYGASTFGPLLEAAVVQNETNAVRTSIRLNGAIFSTDDSSVTQGNRLTIKNYNYVKIGNYNFVCEAFGVNSLFFSSSHNSQVLNVDSANAYSRSYVVQNSNGNEFESISEITGFEFYTYEQ